MGWHRNIRSQLLGIISLFAIEIAILNVLGYFFSVYVPYKVDPLVYNSSIYYGNTYVKNLLLGRNIDLMINLFPNDYYIYGSLFVLIVILSIGNIQYKYKYRYVVNFFIMFAAALFLFIIVFRQELPKPAVINYGLMTGFMTSIAIYIRDYKLHFGYINNMRMDKDIKLERLKLDYDVWSKIFTALIAGFFVFYIGYLQYQQGLIDLFVDRPQDKIICKSAFYLTSLYIPFLFSAVLYEVYRKMIFIKNQTAYIK